VGSLAEGCTALSPGLEAMTVSSSGMQPSEDWSNSYYPSQSRRVVVELGDWWSWRRMVLRQRSPGLQKHMTSKPLDWFIAMLKIHTDAATVDLEPPESPRSRPGRAQSVHIMRCKST